MFYFISKEEEKIIKFELGETKLHRPLRCNQLYFYAEITQFNFAITFIIFQGSGPTCKEILISTMEDGNTFHI